MMLNVMFVVICVVMLLSAGVMLQGVAVSLAAVLLDFEPGGAAEQHGGAGIDEVADRLEQIVSARIKRQGRFRPDDQHRIALETQAGTEPYIVLDGAQPLLGRPLPGLLDITLGDSHHSIGCLLDKLLDGLPAVHGIPRAQGTNTGQHDHSGNSLFGPVAAGQQSKNGGVEQDDNEGMPMVTDEVSQLQQPGLGPQVGSLLPLSREVIVGAPQCLVSALS